MPTLGRTQYRSIPLATQIKVIFGGTLLQFGALFFWFGLPMSLLFVLNSELVNVFKFDGKWVATKGIIQRIEATNASVNEQPIYRYYFSYNVAGQSYQGYSSDTYKYAYDQEEVVEVPVEYKEKNVTRARIQGMRQETFSFWVAFVLIFPLVGGLILFGAMRRNLHALRLLKIGKPIRGTLLRAKDTGSRINEEPIYDYEFAFEVDGRSHIATAKTHLSHLLEDEETELILYNPNNPEDNIIYDGVEGIGKIDLRSTQLPNVGMRAFPNLISTLVGAVVTIVVIISAS